MSDPVHLEQLQHLYAERNSCVALILRLAGALGYRTGLLADPAEPLWPVVYVDLPTGQVSWHLPASFVAELVPELEPYAGVWDGHNSREKYRRVLDYRPPPSRPDAGRPR